jgi:FemAB-related protein (PEP-CTERM system-associated)
VSPSLGVLPAQPDQAQAGKSPVQVRAFEEAIASRWDDFVLSQPGGTFFHLTGWMQVISKTFGFEPRYFYAEREERITAVAPLFSVSSWIGGKALISAPFAVYGGICAGDDESEQALLKTLQQYAHAEGTGYLELRKPSGGLYTGFQANKLYSTFTKELSPDVDANFKRIPNDTRYMIRRATKAGLQSRRGVDQMRIFYRLFSMNMHHHGTPMFPRALFNNLVEEFKGNVDLLVVYLGEEPISAVMSFFFRDTVLPYYAGLGPQANKLAANNFMYWDLMKFAAESGFRRFDFGRSKQGTGAYFFKTQWNMDIQPLDYQVYLVRRKTAPNFSPVNPKFDRATRMWQKLPLWGANLLGPHIVKWFP